ncbi:lipase [Psychroflexus tropicus]|uniref:lipase n=1 Tax=Psychroflexus tropicus TaxID=197345 RepID=UPI0003A8F936|nr:lipase [Psychroflexus tropicus]
MKNYIKYLPFLALGLMACEPEFDNGIEENEVYTNGEADFSNYVALGNSLTAGFADNALYVEGQQNSFPNILAGQFELVGGGEFTQPLMADNLGGLKLNGNQITQNRLVLSSNAGQPVGPQPLAGDPQTEITNILEGPFNNMGVPGAKSYHLLAEGYGNVAGVLAGQANPYFARFASSPQTTILADALAQNPTFFSLWIGNNDILGFATSGGTGVDQTGNLDPSTYAGNDISDPNVFAGAYSGLIEGLTASASGGVVYNIPDVTDIPFFTTVPSTPLDPTDPAFAAQIPTLNMVYGAINQVFVALQQPSRVIQFSTDAASAVVIEDESLTDLSAQIEGALAPNPEFIQLVQSFGLPAAAAPQVAAVLGDTYGQARQAQPEDLLLLTSSSVIGNVDADRVAALVAQGFPQEVAGQFSAQGITLPLSDQFVLTTDEISLIDNARTSYNATIQGLAQANGLAFVDVDGLLQTVSEGISFPGGVITSTFVSGGGFSLDGVHLTPRGYALVANETLRAINMTYGSDLPEVNLGDYGTITLSDNVN